MDRPNNFITEARIANRMVWDGLNALISLQRESTALDYTNTLAPGTGTNEGYTKEEVTAVVFTTANALAAVLAQGHATNISRLL